MAYLSEKDMCVSHKIISCNSHFQTNMIFFQSKTSTEKRNTVLTLKILWHIPNRCFSFESNIMLVSHESISWNSTTFKWTWWSLKVRLQRQGTLFSLLTILWHIPINGLSFQRKACVILIRAFHEIHTLSKERDYLSN